MAKSKGKPQHSTQLTRVPGQRANPTAPGLVWDDPPDAPPGLDQEVVEVWNRVVPELCQLGVLIPIDLEIVVQWCSAIAMAEAMSAELWQLIKAGFADSTEAKRVRIAWKDAVAIVDRIGDQIGATPQSRVRLGAESAKGSALAQIRANLAMTGAES